ncbi:hypothetical protein CEUSTIGMA_g8072.t1 [Chlamydomonas eustigma]|uniref:CMP/dCMP-type deaminase domain-containing protein n=1 Tax=Chlamydomonas eustigma TaxID=1157962 RepID=A0A250XC20_9CHLO|nr:hypothetical protein CEUSTIGMA_g8072.t1 [Chlamydomonas eustigma]|eukprot:GAX80637.1 hypothetical protein CEUSTIGMA_g8072.t1 [Chlamydomonas eustigma]
MNSSLQFLDRLLEVIEKNIAPITSEFVKEGNMLFGGAILTKNDYALVCADTNKITEWPLLHGEISCLRTYNALPAAERPAPTDCIMIATHEPCALCLSAITWTGFDNIYFLFSYADYKPIFDSTKILKQVFGNPNGEYRRENAYWSSYCIAKLVDDLEESDGRKKALQGRVAALRERYNGINKVYEEVTKAKGIHIPRVTGE